MRPLDRVARRQHLKEALRSAVERAERAVQGDEACYSVSEMHDAALDLAQAARALLNELETRYTK